MIERTCRQPVKGPARPDVAVVIVAHNAARWLPDCLDSVFAHAGTCALETIVVDNGSTDQSCRLVEDHPMPVRLIRATNDGFGAGNNRGIESTDARYVLFLNADTQILNGTLADLVAEGDARQTVGVMGVRQVTADGTLWPTIRRFPSVPRALGEALGSERWPWHPSWAGERELDLDRYEHDVSCDWTSGSFMFVRREALLSAGVFDERFFLFCEETDLCLRIKRAGWEIRHVPLMTILHHAGKSGIQPRLVAQEAFSRRRYAGKHFSGIHRASYVAVTAFRHALRWASGGSATHRKVRREAARAATRAVLGRGEPPFAVPPATALVLREADLAPPGMSPRIRTASPRVAWPFDD